MQARRAWSVVLLLAGVVLAAFAAAAPEASGFQCLAAALAFGLLGLALR